MNNKQTIPATDWSPSANNAPAAPKPKPLPPYKPVTLLDKTLLLKVFKIQNPSQNRACNDAAIDTIVSLAPPDCTVVRKGGNLLIRKGPAHGLHPYFMAHMDQVHDYVPYMSLTVSRGELSAYDGNRQQCGVGGDDKCGIYLALHMLHTLDHVTCVFVRDEEVGCLGSREVPLEWFRLASFVLQADRNNQTFDIIRDTNGMCCASDDFMEAILSLPACLRHRSASGSITDIGELASRQLGVSMVNISSGYHDPHSEWETVNLKELRIACDVAYQMATQHGNVPWPHNPTYNRSTYGGYSGGATAVGARASLLNEPTIGMSKLDIDDWMWHSSEAAVVMADHRARVIGQLTEHYGYDLDVDALTHQTTTTLEALVYHENGFDPDDLGWDEADNEVSDQMTREDSLTLEEREHLRYL